jgi:hypothetical protein
VKKWQSGKRKTKENSRELTVFRDCSRKLAKSNGWGTIARGL